MPLVATRSDDLTASHEVGSPSANGAEVLQRARTELVHRLRSLGTEHLETVLAHVQMVAPCDGADDPLLAVGLRETIAACLDCGLAAIEQGLPAPGPMSPAITSHLQYAASSGVSLTTALRRSVAAHTLAWTHVLREVADSDLSVEQRIALLADTAYTMGSVLALLQQQIAEVHTAEIRGRMRSHEHRRAEIVGRLLACESTCTSELAELGYELDAWHVALIASGAKAKDVVRLLAGELGRQSLPIQTNETTVWGWLGGPNRPAIDDIERAYAKLCPADTMIAVGEPARGIDGWRISHREAKSALLVAHERQTRLTRYLDVALEAVALQDEALADSLIEKYLLPLDSVPIGGQMARRTVRALFDAEHNVSSAAIALNVHRSSVHRWREQIEQRLGYRLHEHRAEIETALRVDELRLHSATTFTSSGNGTSSPNITRTTGMHQGVVNSEKIV